MCLRLTGKALLFFPLLVNTRSGCSQTTLSFHPATQSGTCSSPTLKIPPFTGSKVRVAELVVERMQQFKRVAPDQLKHSTDCSLPKSLASGDFAGESQEQNSPESGKFVLFDFVRVEGVLWVG